MDGASSREPLAPLPLLEHLPALREIPRAELGRVAPPLERDPQPEAGELWVWRDDRNAPVAAGNKLRSLEWLLGGVTQHHTVLTVGGFGSTHVLATATHAARLGAATVAVRWPHEMNAVSRAVRELAASRCARVHDHPVPLAIPLAAWLRTTRFRRAGTRYVPFGASSPLGVLGHVNAALELAARVRAGEAPEPAAIVLPVGSACTIAGLLVGTELAGWEVDIVGARCGPRAGVTRARILRLATRARRMIAHLTGSAPPANSQRITLDHSTYGGAYGRPLPEAQRLAHAFRERTGTWMDPTYGAKALLTATRLSERRDPVLIWATFDGRELAETATRP